LSFKSNKAQEISAMISNDNPISEPKDDLFGVDPFAQAVAKGIENLSTPEGTVLALTGAWGSGKSSAVNLVVHHLKSVENLEVISFNPWWYSSEDLLTKAFFQHLYAGLGKSLSEKGRAIILALSKKVLNAGTVISTVANFFTFGLGGAAAKEAASAAADFIKAGRTAEQEVKLLGKELGEQQKRFLIVIDDIDRLTPEQTLLVFRLVKSVGRLPNVIYLLVFDRDWRSAFCRSVIQRKGISLRKLSRRRLRCRCPIPRYSTTRFCIRWSD
jgi:predicted KAP-like P-loop ATPase